MGAPESVSISLKPNLLQVNWQPVFWGIAIQYIFALVILRTTWGYDAFEWIGDRVTEFIECAQAGADFVFGGLPKQKIFAFCVCRQYGPRREEKLLQGICGQRRPRSACAFAQSDQDLRCPLTESLETVKYISGGQRT